MLTAIYIEALPVDEELADQGLLDEEISDSFNLIIRMWVNTKHFPTYWKIVRGEFNETFVSYVDEQAKLASIKL